ncbi:hypothetical protein C4D60_Mb10t09400 [Musa balbisiana]|uniref:Uncharacterized protein n=1 Tax=Musa balbisiana TaxID=52838 RepID=A0A4S8IVW7_MUSBA|nr:hypothetical protein C4D60_Mb10t09400 [Musa balbisiana]
MGLLGLFHIVGFTYPYPHTVGGLQHPDCKCEVGPKELIGGEVGLIPAKFLANIGRAEAGADLRPVVGDVMAEPNGEAAEAVLAVGAAGDRVGAVGASDGEGEDEEGEEEDDEGGHAEEVGGEQALLVPVGADEACKGDEHEEHAEDDDGPPGEADALVVLFGGQPNARADHGHGAQQAHEVEQGRDVVAHAHGDLQKLETRWWRRDGCVELVGLGRAFVGDCLLYRMPFPHNTVVNVPDFMGKRAAVAEVNCFESQLRTHFEEME